MSLVEKALEYAEMGLAVFPVNRNKSPCTPHGCKDAKTDPGAIRAWWKKWPDANIGIATGSKSGGIVVIDVDIDENKGIYGNDSLREWEHDNGELPETWRSITGRGGYHIFYRTDEVIKNTTNLYPGIDIRGEGGYIIAPPSLHKNGREYEWEYSPDDVELHFADDQVMRFIRKSEHSQSVKQHFELPESIMEGQRNDTLYRYGCSLQSQGYDDAEILERLQSANQRCDVPLDDSEISTIFTSVISYEKGTRPIRYSANHRPPRIVFNEKGAPVQSSENVVEAVTYDDELYQRIRMNSLAYAPYVFGALPWDDSNQIREWNNIDDAYLRNYLEKNYGLKNNDRIMDGLTIVANQNKYNPVIEELERCHLQWDGKKHIENILPGYLGVEKCRYTTEVLKLFMLGAITRAYNPGCKFDYVPIIYGSQGCGKSTFCRALAMADEWYDDNFNTIEGDKAAEKLRGLWMAELAELLATKKAKELESIKSFLTSRSDNYRPPYARRTEQRKRVCVFIGTTNSDHFLTDRTGNRRFLPLIADKAEAKYTITKPENFKRALIDIRNAWGEAMEIYTTTKDLTLVLPEDIERDVLEMQNRFREDDPQVGVIQDYLDHLKSDRVCAQELWSKALKNSGQAQKFEINSIHTIMQQEIKGWKRSNKKQRCGEYGPQVCYVRDKDNFLEANPEDLPFV